MAEVRLPFPTVTIVQTVLVYAVIPVGVSAIFAALFLRPSSRKAGQYKSGEGWDYPAVWWAASPDEEMDHEPGSSVLESSSHSSAGAVADLIGGGARGTW